MIITYKQKGLKECETKQSQTWRHASTKEVANRLSLYQPFIPELIQLQTSLELYSLCEKHYNQVIASNHFYQFLLNPNQITNFNSRGRNKETRPSEIYTNVGLKKVISTCDFSAQFPEIKTGTRNFGVQFSGIKTGTRDFGIQFPEIKTGTCDFGVQFPEIKSGTHDFGVQVQTTTYDPSIHVYEIDDMIYSLEQFQKIIGLLAASELECEQKTYFNLILDNQIQQLQQQLLNIATTTRTTTKYGTSTSKRLL